VRVYDLKLFFNSQRELIEHSSSFLWHEPELGQKTWHYSPHVNIPKQY